MSELASAAAPNASADTDSSESVAPRLNLVDLTMPLGAKDRFGRLFAAWTLLFLASPGVLSEDGSSFLAILGAFAWAATVVRPAGTSKRARRKTFFVEWAAGCYGFALQMIWIWWVIPFGFMYPGLGQGLYAAVSGLLARFVSKRHGPVVGAFAGWIALEVLRTLLETPFGLGWQRAAHCGLDTWAQLLPYFGIEGAAIVMAALAAAGVGLLGSQSGSSKTRTMAVVGVLGLLAGRMLPGSAAGEPSGEVLRALSVQPGLTQERKMQADPQANFQLSRNLTFDALESDPAPVDLVCWGESMLTTPVVSQAAVDGIEKGLSGPGWDQILGFDYGPRSNIRLIQASERAVRELLVDYMPAGTAFLSGAESFDRVHDQIRRRNVVVLWNSDGKREPLAGKRILVPFAETMYGLETTGWIRNLVLGMAGYVPDFQPEQETGILTLRRPEQRPLRIGGNVCFDNAFEHPFFGVGGEEGVDLFVVASNEAWYRNAFEMDQMVAFTRALALMTGRPFLRSTNSGVTIAFDGQGREIDRLRVEGADRGVSGTLRVSVPLPHNARQQTVYAGIRSGLRTLIVLGLALLLVTQRKPLSQAISSSGDGTKL